MNTKYSIFSSMQWLDTEIERNAKSPGRNSDSDRYYELLLEIRTAQENGTITDEIYSKLNPGLRKINPEEGYYLANIHYDLYSDFENINKIEERIIHFLDKSDPDELINNFCIRSMLLHDLRFSILKRNEVWKQGEDIAVIKKYGSPLELEILGRVSIRQNRNAIHNFNAKKQN